MFSTDDLAGFLQVMARGKRGCVSKGEEMSQAQSLQGPPGQQLREERVGGGQCWYRFLVCLVTKSCPLLATSRTCSTPGFPVQSIVAIGASALVRPVNISD